MKIGKFDVPVLRLYPTLVDNTKAIYDKFHDAEATDMNVVAQLCGHKTANSGAWFEKRAAFNAYHLTEGRGGLRVSDIGKKLAYPNPKNPAETGEAVKAAVLSIPLWQELFSKYGASLPASNFWVDLANIASIPAPEAQKVEKWVQNAYSDDIRHLPAGEMQQTSAGGAGLGDTKPGDMGESVLGRFQLKDVGYVDIKDADTYEIAESYLKVLAKKLGITQSTDDKGKKKD